MAVVSSPTPLSTGEIWAAPDSEFGTINSDTSFELKWNNYASSLPSAFESMRRAEDFVDVTLATSGGLQGDAVGNRYKAHRYQDIVLLTPRNCS